MIFRSPCVHRHQWFSRFTVILTVGVLVSVASIQAAETQERPNFLVLIADDLTWRDLGVTGNKDIKTPRIERLAGESMTLRGMFTPAACCSPARHALYTGLFPVRSGAYPNHTMVDEGTKSVFTYLNALGYRTGLLGKQHIQPKSSFPFENLGGDPDDTGALARFINRNPYQPWMAVVASNDPHVPWTRGSKTLYNPAKLSLPPWLHDNPETRRALAVYYAEITEFDRQVGECIDALDQSGQAGNTLVLLLTEQGSQLPGGGKWNLYDNGIRVAAFARWPGRIEPGSSSDALMQYVDVAPTFIAAAGGDPTTIDTGCPNLAGGRGFDGRSFLGVLRGQQTRLRDFVYAEDTAIGIIGNKNPYPKRAVRDARYKLIRNLAPENEWWIRGIHGSEVYQSWVRDAATNPALAARVAWLSRRPAEELYDLQSDEYETKNLAADPACATIKAGLQEALDAWMKQQGDKGLETELAAPSRQPKNARDDAAEGGKKKRKKGAKKAAK